MENPEAEIIGTENFENDSDYNEKLESLSPQELVELLSCEFDEIRSLSCSIAYGHLTVVESAGKQKDIIQDKTKSLSERCELLKKELKIMYESSYSIGYKPVAKLVKELQSITEYIAAKGINLTAEEPSLKQ